MPKKSQPGNLEGSQAGPRLCASTSSETASPFQLTSLEMQLIRDFRRLDLDCRELHAAAISNLTSYFADRRSPEKAVTRPALRLVAGGVA